MGIEKFRRPIMAPGFLDEDGQPYNPGTGEFIPVTDKGAPNGVATLDGEGKLGNEQLSFGGLGDPAGPLAADGTLPVAQVPGSTVGKAVLAATDAAAARTAIGAGTSNLALGTTGTTAAAGNHTHAAATTGAPGFMSASDKTKLDGIQAGANNYVLPGATASTLGGVRQGVAVPDAAGVEPTKAEFDALLASLRAAGVIAT